MTQPAPNDTPASAHGQCKRCGGPFFYPLVIHDPDVVRCKLRLCTKCWDRLEDAYRRDMRARRP